MTNVEQTAAAVRGDGIDQQLVARFDADFPIRPIPPTGPVELAPISESPAVGHDLDGLWRAIEPETRARRNDIHLPLSLAYAERLCNAYPAADRRIVRVATVLHDTGWAHVDETRIISEGFGPDWRRSHIRFEHERQGCEVARRVLPDLGYDDAFIERVCAIIDGHDTRPVAYSLEDALVRDADRLWRFNHTGIALSSSWFGLNPSQYGDRLAREIVPEMLTEVGRMLAETELERSRRLLKLQVLR